jgi:RNA polymerase sigma factor for flagellar operon FliA
VRTIAKSIQDRLPVHLDADDLVQAGTLGLIDAANKYNSQKQNTFSTYAKHRIRGSILDSLRKLDWASRDMRRRQKLVGAAIAELSVVLERSPSEMEVAEKLGMNVVACRVAMTQLHNGGPVSASGFSDDHKDLPLPEFVSASETQPDFMCGREEMRGFLDDAVKTLPERHQKVVFMYYAKDMSMKEIGCALQVNESRVSQIHKSALAKMGAVLKANGIASHQAFLD